MGLGDEIGSLKRMSILFSILIFGHFGYTSLFPITSDTNPLWTSFGSTIVLWQVVVWSACSLYWWLDNHPDLGSKLGGKKLAPVFGVHQEPAWKTQIPIAARNMIFAVILLPFLAHNISTLPAINFGDIFRTLTDSNQTNLIFDNIELFGGFKRYENENLLRTFLWFFVYIFLADVIFYPAHIIMHRVRFCWSTHALHHSSHALCAISGYYMSILDFLLEHCPVFVAFFIFPECGPAWVITISVGAFNLLTTHSGWDIPFCPDPVPHFLHHSKHHFNYGIMLDHIFGTAATVKEMDLTRTKTKQM